MRLTKEQSIIIGAYTGILAGDFGALHEYIEKILGRPVWTHEFASKDLWKIIQEKSKEDFLSLIYIEEKGIEKVDNLTNDVMDIVRDTFNLDPDSDQDDELYTKVHNAIKEGL